MPSDQDERRAGILRVAELALTQFEAAGESPSVVGELRRAIAEAQDDPKDSGKVEALRRIMINEPELEALLRKEFPEGRHPRPFRLGRKKLQR